MKTTVTDIRGEIECVQRIGHETSQIKCNKSTLRIRLLGLILQESS